MRILKIANLVRGINPQREREIPPGRPALKLRLKPIFWKVEYITPREEGSTLHISWGSHTMKKKKALPVCVKRSTQQPIIIEKK